MPCSAFKGCCNVCMVGINALTPALFPSVSTSSKFPPADDGDVNITSDV